VTDTNRESLSALIDGEASELEVHRLVREFGADESLTSSWTMYQQVRTTVRSGRDELSVSEHQVLLSRISASIEAEDTHQTVTQSNSSSPKRVMVGSLALAASLVVTIFIGIQEPATDAQIAASSERAPIDVQTVAHTASPGVSAGTQSGSASLTPELVELDEEKQRRLRAYLNQHDRMTRLNAEKQFVNYKETSNR
jgi:sigma-E factor negative regulatory protein RseA